MKKKQFSVGIREDLVLLMEKEKGKGVIYNYTYFVEQLIFKHFKRRGLIK